MCTYIWSACARTQIHALYAFTRALALAHVLHKSASLIAYDMTCIPTGDPQPNPCAMNGVCLRQICINHTKAIAKWMAWLQAVHAGRMRGSYMCAVASRPGKVKHKTELRPQPGLPELCSGFRLLGQLPVTCVSAIDSCSLEKTENRLFESERH